MIRCNVIAFILSNCEVKYLLKIFFLTVIFQKFWSLDQEFQNAQTPTIAPLIHGYLEDYFIFVQLMILKGNQSL